MSGDLPGPGPGRHNVVILDRVTDLPQADTPYCVHGRTMCMAGCGHWLWLGDRTLEVVSSGAALPVCLPCARRLVPADQVPTDNLGDHRRADGPH